jgi:hypothetical protein
VSFSNLVQVFGTRIGSLSFLQLVNLDFAGKTSVSSEKAFRYHEPMPGQMGCIV